MPEITEEDLKDQNYQAELERAHRIRMLRYAREDLEGPKPLWRDPFARSILVVMLVAAVATGTSMHLYIEYLRKQRAELEAEASAAVASSSAISTGQTITLTCGPSEDGAGSGLLVRSVTEGDGQRISIACGSITVEPEPIRRE